MAHRMNIIISLRCRAMLKELAKDYGSMSRVIEMAVTEFYNNQQETRTMKHIKTGETNDLHLYAVEADGRYYPLSDSDLNFEKPDAKIYYDSGVYPGVTDLEQYVCDKASE